jgi:hypothetical protein
LIVLLADFFPDAGVTFESAVTNLSWPSSMSSSSLAIISRPVSEPVPCEIPPVLIEAVLSALIVIHESIWNWLNGPLLANGLSAACALAPSAAATALKPTISAPPPFTNVLRESSPLTPPATPSAPPAYRLRAAWRPSRCASCSPCIPPRSTAANAWIVPRRRDGAYRPAG